MILENIKNSEIENCTNCNRVYIRYKSINKIDTMLVRVRKKGKKKTIEKFPVRIVNNEDGTDTLLLVPLDKIRVTPCKDKKTKKVNFSIENADFFIHYNKIQLKVLGIYREYWYVCEFCRQKF